MKRYFYILFVGALLSLTSCVMDETIDPIAPTPGTDGGFQFIAIAEDFDKHNVGTRAAGDSVSDSHISEMTMLIFKNDGKLLPAVDANKNPLPSSHINIKKPNPTFLINANKYEGTGILASMEDGISLMYYENRAVVDGKSTGIDSCRIYIVANAYHLIGERLEAGDIKSINDLHNALVDTDASLSMPYDENGQPIGLPMIGTHGDETFDLTYGGKGKNAIATIPLKKLYSKICFRIQVNSNQIVANGPTPKFMINRAEVYNVPSKIRMGYTTGDYVENVVANPMYLYTSTPCEIREFKNDKTTISHSSSATTNDVIEFEFFMPEHMVTPISFTYPWEADNNEDNDKEFENYRQYFKPTGLSGSVGGQSTTKIAPYVRICGTYYDHNAQIKDVSYDIYLGQNEYDDFEIKRNQQLNNHIAITGLTNHKYAYGGDDNNNVSVDHRVTVTNKGYYIHMEREAILDAHFEVRPIDVELQAGSSMTITIPEKYRGWIAMESDEAARANNATGKYVSNSENKAVRKYFTEGLISELTTANGGSIRIPSGGTAPETKTYRVWFYVDENPNVYDKTGTGKLTSESGSYTVSKTLYRNAPVTFEFSGIASTDPNQKVDAGESVINFQQWNLWRVWSADGNRYYDIEHEEEYLNNYVSDADYVSFPNGMPWGLEDLHFSFDHRAMFMDKSGINIFTSIVNWIVEKFSPEYDYYLLGDVANENATIHHLPGYTVSGQVEGGNSGRVFFNEIIAENRYQDSDDNYVVDPNRVAIQDIVRSLTEKPESAVEYCNNKNYRDASTGKVSTHNWYLPSIDEMQEIAVGAYDEFNKVFQNNFYWSSQPAYVQQHVHYDNIIHRSGSFMTEDPTRARATKVYVAPNSAGVNEWKYTESGVTGYYKRNYINGTSSSNFHSYDVPVEGYTYSWVTLDGIRPVTKTDFVAPLERQPGCKLRTESCRIRAVYRSGTK